MLAHRIFRNFRRSGLAALSLLAAGMATAADLSTTRAFAPADATRGNYMDRAGVWNGSTEATNTTGDTFTTEIINTGATAFDLSVEVDLPTGFSYVNGSASVSTTGVGTPSVSASQSGSTLTISLDAGEFDLTGGGDSIEIDYGLRAAASVAGGTYQLTYRYIYGDNETDPSPTTETRLQNILVQEGDSVLSLTPSTQTVGVGETAAWTVTVTNTGFGGLFDVAIDQSDLFGNPSFTAVNTTQTSPALVASESGNVYTIPYLAPGETFSFTTEGDVAGCENLGKEASTNDRTGLTAQSRVGPVVLDLDLPLVAFTPPNIQLDYLSPTTVMVPVDNVAGAGAAEDFRLATNLNSLPVTISGVTGGFNYNPANGEFTLVSGPNGSNIAETDSETLEFIVTPDDTCSSGGGTITWLALYTNECDQPYFTPFAVSSLQAPTGAPSVDLSVDNSGPNRLANGESGSIDINLSADQIARIDTDPIVVDITIDAGTASIDGVNESAGTLTNVGGGNYEWSVSKADADTGQVIVVDFTIGMDPCLGGQQFDVSATTSAQSVLTSSGDICPISASGNQTIFITNNPGAEAQQFFNVTGGTFEAGAPSTTDSVRDNGEGEFIPIVAEYEFGSGYPGQWTDSTYFDDFGGVATQTIVEGSLTVRRATSGGSLGSAVAVPSASFTKTAAGLLIDLDFLADAGFFNDPLVSDTRIRIEYLTTVPDAELSGGSRGIRHDSVLTLNGGDGAGSCLDGVDRVFRQTLAYTVQRAVADLNVNIPSSLEVCEVFDVVLTLGNGNGQAISRPLVTLDTSNPDYEFVLPQTPIYGGEFNSGNITYSPNGGNNPTFEYTGGDLPGDGTITVQMVRSSDSGTNVSPVSAEVDYDDNETNPTPARDFNTSASDAPTFVLTGQLTAVVTPGTSIQMNDGRVEWSILVQNVESGTAIGAEVLNQIPPFLSVNVTETDAANPVNVALSGSPTTGGQLATFDLGDLGSGQTHTLRVIADLVPGSNCSIPNGQNSITVQWGCGPEKAQVVPRDGPDIRFGAGRLQVLHDTTNSPARLCGNGEVVIRVKNTGDGEITEVDIFELMPESTTGLSIVPGSAEFATDNAPSSFTSIADPSGDGSAGNRYTFEIGPGRQINIPELVGTTDDDGTTVNEVIIRFDIEATDPNVFAGSGGPSLTASGDATLFCGGSVISPGIPFVIPSEIPDITSALTVANTTLSLAAAERVPGAASQVVEWLFEVTNSGNAVAENVRIRIPLTASGGSATISGHGASGSYTGGWTAINDIDPGETVTITVTETLGTTCVDTTSTAEVTWGCDNTVPSNAPSEVVQPSDNDDEAEVFMNPDFITEGGQFTQSFNRRADGRGRVRITMNNQGAKAINLAITEDLPNNVEIDTSVAPSFVSNSSSLTAVTLDAGSPLDAPVFEFTGDLEYDESFTIEFFVRSIIEDTTRATNFPELAGKETTGNGLDPAVSLGGDATVTADYENSCGDLLDYSFNSSVDPRQPDLDINLVSNNGSESATLTNRIVFPGVQETFNIWVRNVGEFGSRAANNTVVVTLGTGWTSANVTLAGNPPDSVAGGVYTFNPGTIGGINRNQQRLIVVEATPSGLDSAPLSLQVDVDSEQILEDGSTVGGQLTSDSRAFRALALEVEKDLISSSEGFTTDPNLAIGEEATFDLRVKFSGATSDSNAVSNLVIRDSLGNSGAANFGLGLVSIDTSGSELEPVVVSTVPAGMTTADPLVSGVIDFSLAAPGAIAPANDEFTATIVTRLLNDTDNTEDKSLINNLGLSLDYYGVTYHSDDSDDGFSGGVAISGLHDQESITVQRPTLSVTKEVRNETDGGGFAATATGEATDIFEYRVVLTNTDTSTIDVPIFDLNWTDTINAKLDLLDGSGNAAYTPGADTTGNGVVDVSFAGGVTPGAGGQLVVNATNLPIGNSGQDFERLDPGESVTVIYFASSTVGVNPGETLADDVTVNADTLPGASGSQTGTTGATDDEDGALELTASASASINVFSVEQSKQIITTSVGSDASSTVVIGEQIEFEVEITLPQGTAPNLNIVDTLSQEFELIEVGAVDVGSALSVSGPTITPASLPANGTPDFDLTWDFGTAVATAGTDAERSITVRYTVQVRNLELASLSQGGSFVNSASYSFDGAPPVSLTDVTLTVAEAVVTVDKDAAPSTGLDAGDEVTFSVTVDNSAGNATAYDIDLVDTLPDGLTYLPGSTTVTSSSGLTGTLGDPDIAANVLTWGRSQSTAVDLDLAAGGQFVYTYTAVVDDTVEPELELTNSLVADWTSLDGAPGVDLGVAVGTPGAANGERIGDGTGPNSYLADDDATVTINNTTTQTKTSSGDTLPLDTTDEGFRVGDLVTYTVEVTVMEGTHEELRILDTLPAGMAFEDFQAITPVSGDDGFTYTALVGGTTAPTQGDTGNLSFDLGTVVNAGDADTNNDVLTLVYRARVLDDAAITIPDGDGDTDDSTLERTNSVRVRFLDAEDEVFTTDAETVDIEVKQPELVLEKTRLTPVPNNKVDSGDPASFRVTVENVGDAPAYNARVLDTLPEGMRAATPTLTVATLDGNDVLAGITPTYDTVSGEWAITLSDAQILEPGASLILEYGVTIDAAVPGGTLMVNEADVPEYYSKPSADTAERRVYDNVTPDSEALTLILRVRGTVFEDLSLDRNLDAGEDWQSGSTVYVNLIQGGSIVDSVRVDPGTGEYVFVDVDPGNYSLILTDFRTNPIAVAPPEFIFFDPAPTDGELAISLVDEDLVDRNFPVVRGSILTGVVFEDTGTGSAVPNNGVQEANESGIGNVTVRLTNGSGTVYDTTLTNGEGEFRLFVPPNVPDGATLAVEQLDLPNYLSTGGGEGTTGGSYARSTDSVTFLHTVAENQSGLAFGDVPPNSFITDGQQTIEPGAVAFYTHTFTAGTGGEVSFDIDSADNPVLPGWGQTLFIDSNCNGQLDAGEPRIDQPSAPITVVAGEVVCIIVKDSSPVGAPFGAQNLNTVSATFSYTGSAPPLPDDELLRTDLTTVGNPTTAGLELLKAVDKTTASPGELITYTLTYTNNGAGPLNDIVIYDTTPAFTTFTAAPVPTLPLSLTSVTITTPAVGDAGGITWTFDGVLDPGETGTVTYEVTVDESP